MSRLTEAQKSVVEQLVPRIRGLVWSFAAKRGRSVVARGDDLLSHLYFVLCRRATKIDPDRPETHWVLVGRCKYAVRDWMRSSMKSDRNGPLIGDIECSSYVDRIDMKDEIEWMMGQLTALQKKAMLMRAIGYSRKEIAEELGCSVESVKKLVFRGLRECRRTANDS